MTRGLPIGPFALAAAITACVGATVGAERSALPLASGLGAAAWGAAAFVAAFGTAKAVANLIAGPSALRLGRRRTLLLGWLIAVPVPFALAFTGGGWPIVAANVLLGVSQGLCWTTALVMQVDLAGSRRRGLAAGVNEFSGYVAVGVAAYAAAIMAGQLDARRGPALVAAVAIAIGIALSLAARETAPAAAVAVAPQIRRRAQPAARAVIHQAGFVNNANDALAWAFVPVLLVARGANIAEVGAVAAVYPASWGLTQLGAGPLSDRIGRRTLIVGGMLFQSVAIAGLAAGWAAVPLAAVWGLGTGMVYPSLVAAAADVAPHGDVTRAIAMYRFWRDAGVAGGALGALILVGRFGLVTTLLAVAALTAGSGLLALLLPARGPGEPLGSGSTSSDSTFSKRQANRLAWGYREGGRNAHHRGRWA